MTEWKTYESHKTVLAKRIVRIENAELFVDGPDGQVQFWPTERAMIFRANVGDYAVVYLNGDGYKSVSPAKAFDEGYTEVVS